MRWAFAAEARGEVPKGTGRSWAHRWKCWTNPAFRGAPGCADAMRVLAELSKGSRLVPIAAGHRPKKKAARRRAA